MENKTKEPQDPKGKNWTWTIVAEKKLNEAKLKKAFRIKLFEICKTRTKKSSPDLFNFYVISAGLDMASDTGRVTTCWRNFKAPWLQTERTKSEGSSEKMSFNAETVLKFQTEKTKKSSHRMENKTKEPRNPEGKNWTWTM